MKARNSITNSFMTVGLIWVCLVGSLPVGAQGDFVTSSDISGGTSVFVFRTSSKAKKSNFVARRKSSASRTTSQRRGTRKQIVSQTKKVAKRYRTRRNIKTVTPQEFQQAEIQLKRKSPEEASRIFAGAAEYFIEKESDLQKASEYLEQAIELDKTNKDAKLALSELSVTLGNNALDDTSISRPLRASNAVSFFERAIENDPLNALGYTGLGQVYDEQDENEKARDYYEKALQIDSSLSAVKASLGYIYYGEGRIADADKLVTEALAEGEDNAEVNYFLGLIRYKQNSDDAAEAALRKSISQDSENAEAHYYLGAVLTRKGKDKEGIREFETSVALDPKFVNAWFDLGVAYYNSERYEEAIRAFEKAVDENTNNSDELRGIYAESFANWAETYRQMGQFDLAISKYRVAVTLEKNDADLLSTFGFVLGAKGLWKDAIANFQKAVEVKPDAVGYANLGWAYLKSAMDNRSLRYFDREKADLEKAQAALTQSIAIDGQFVAAHFNLGVVKNGLGKHDEAIDSLKIVVKNRKDWLPGVFELGVAYLEAGDYNNATKQLTDAIDIDKKFALAYFNLGKSEQMRGKTKEAQKALSSLRKLDAKLAERLDTYFIQNPR